MLATARQSNSTTTATEQQAASTSPPSRWRISVRTCAPLVRHVGSWREIANGVPLWPPSRADKSLFFNDFGKDRYPALQQTGGRIQNPVDLEESVVRTGPARRQRLEWAAGQPAARRRPSRLAGSRKRLRSPTRSSHLCPQPRAEGLVHLHVEAAIDARAERVEAARVAGVHLADDEHARGRFGNIRLNRRRDVVEFIVASREWPTEPTGRWPRHRRASSSARWSGCIRAIRERGRSTTYRHALPSHQRQPPRRLRRSSARRIADPAVSPDRTT